MHSSPFPPVLGPDITRALVQKGFEALTPVQLAVLDPALAGRDLRITSQTGSGKTVAVGLALRSLLTPETPEAPARDRDRGQAGPQARPRALLVAPTRELAKQVEEELSWLYTPLGARVVSVTGGASVRDERRALAGGPAVVVGTPGRLLDHLRRGAIDGAAVGAVVLDEADRLLDMGFREDLEAILAFVPGERRTHLVSATFPREVKALADAAQRDPVHVEGTRLGAANVDIDHVVHLIESRQRVDALVNLLLANPDEQMLVFARTRADVASVAGQLKDAGFAAAPLSGEMDQPARNRALAAFKSGGLRVLVATDVAARGIDVQDIARVVHVEAPTDLDSYTHRSGRTGRAGRKGTSSVLASQVELPRTLALLRRAGVPYRFEAIPSAESIRAASDERAAAELTKDDDVADAAIDDRVRALAGRIVAAGNVARAIARLLARARYAGPAEPRVVRSLDPRAPRGHEGTARGERGARGAYPDRGPARGQGGAWVPFHVSWGRKRLADPRRLLAMVCRRGQIRGSDVGAIRVDDVHSIVNVASHVAEAFARATAVPDPREPGVVIRRETEGPGAPAEARRPPPGRPHAPPRPYPPRTHSPKHRPGPPPTPGAAPPKRRAR
jgi:ATP-dependent RNA helicase DeaD